MAWYPYAWSYRGWLTWCLHAWGEWLSAKLHRFVQPNGEPYIIYGDPAYGIIQNIIAPFHQAHLTDDEQEFNTRKSKVRTCVKWGFDKICQNVLFSCMHSYQLSHLFIRATAKTEHHLFNLELPSLKTYLSNPWPCFTLAFKAIAVLMGLVLYKKDTPPK